MELLDSGWQRASRKEDNAASDDDDDDDDSKQLVPTPTSPHNCRH
jgi:hypothetical protein